MPGSRGHFPAVPESRLREPPDWDLTPNLPAIKPRPGPNISAQSTTSDFTLPTACQAIPHYYSNCLACDFAVCYERGIYNSKKVKYFSYCSWSLIRSSTVIEDKVHIDITMRIDNEEST